MSRLTPEYFCKELESIFMKSCVADLAPTRRHKILVRGELELAMCDASLDAYDKVIKSLLKNADWALRFSEEFIEGKVNAILLNLAEGMASDDVKILVRDLIEYLQNYSKEHVVYLPLTGVEVEGQPVCIGNITIKEITDAELVSILGNWEERFPDLPEGAVARQEHVRETQRIIIETIRRTTCTEFHAIAEPIRAQQRATEETRRILDLLRYSIPALYPKDAEVKIGLMGDLFQGPVMRLILATNFADLTRKGEHVGPLQPLRLTPENIEHMHNIGVFKLSDVLLKPYNNTSPFERSLLQAVHWFANAQTRNDPSDQLRDLVTCLEVYLTPKDGNPIGTAVAEGVAIIVGTDVSDRIRIKKQIKALYSMRSAVSHGGQTSVAQKDVDSLEQIAGQLTMILIERSNQFKRTEDLLNWVEVQKFS